MREAMKELGFTPRKNEPTMIGSEEPLSEEQKKTVANDEHRMNIASFYLDKKK